MPGKKASASLKITGLENINCKPQTPGCSGAVYGLGVIGALFYYLTTATSIWAGVLGIVKAILWPAVLVYGALKSFGL